jgi:GNAT superfamily N-acetyltransferase
MTRPAPSIEAFVPEMATGAGELLAALHREARRSEPSLDDLFEDPGVASSYLSHALKQGATGVAALDNDKVIAYLLCEKASDDSGAHVWSESGWQGWSADSGPAPLGQLYATEAARWVTGGIGHHFVVAGLHDPGGISTWQSLAFAREQVHAITEARPMDASFPFDVRRAEPEDIDLVSPAFPLIADAHSASPVFAYIGPSFREELRPGHLGLLNDEDAGYMIATENGELLGFSIVVPVRDEDATPITPRGSVAHVVAATMPEARGRGVQAALTAAVLGWAHERDFRTCVTDWRSANLDSSVVWPALGFRPTAVRFHRIIDPRVLPT